MLPLARITGRSSISVSEHSKMTVYLWHTSTQVCLVLPGAIKGKLAMKVEYLSCQHILAIGVPGCDP